jgi:multidrug efflux pump subunit AcrA (membrane-fusion protein)
MKSEIIAPPVRQSVIKKYLSLPPLIKYGSIILLVALIWFGWSKMTASAGAKTQYQTATATKDTLIVSVSGSGNVSSANSATVTTQTSGVVSKIFVKNGDTVKSGDAIAEVDLDMEGKQRSAQAYASYLSAKNSLQSAQDQYYALQSDLFTKWKTYTDLAQNGTYENGDNTPNTTNRQAAEFISTNDNWLSAEAKYKAQQSVVAQSQTALSSAWASYQQSSPTIYAPISGTLNGLSLQIGSVLTAQTSSTGNSTSQRIANIKTDATPVAVINLSEIDVPKIKIGQKATITISAFTGQTFTGKVASIDTTGSVSSGVTTYPAYIVFDTAVDGIYPNMALDAKIITDVRADAILVPNAAVQTTNGMTTVRIMRNGNETQTDVTVGKSDDTHTEILSGVKEGDVVVTGTSTTGTKTTGTTSVFSTLGRTGGGGNAVRIGGR